MIFNDLFLQHREHASLDDLWNHPLYSDIVQPLQRRTVIYGTTSQRFFQECIGEARTYAHCHDEKSVAVVLTKPPETILLICKDVRRDAPWFLFDSHGNQFDNPKKAFVMRYGSVETAAAALLEKFPNIEGLGDTFHAQQMNMFEAHAIVRKPQVTLGVSRFTTSSVDGSTLLQVGQELHLQDSINAKALADPECRDKRNTHDKLSGALLHSRDSISGKPFAKAVVSDRRHPHEKLSDAQAPFQDYVVLEGFADAVKEPLSKLVTKDSTIQVEKLDARNQHDYPSSAFVPRYASLTKPPSAAFAAEENQRGDEEMARLLSLQMNGTRDNRSQLMLMSPSRPLGDMIAEANFSQYAIEGGRSACTSICLYAAAQLLNKITETPSCITTGALDGYLQDGTMIFNDLFLQHREHASLDDLWNHPLYSDIVQPLQRRTVIYGTTSQRSFQECIGEARTYAHCHDEKSVAVVLTKPPETILLICKDVRRDAPWFLFDSHGNQFDNPKKAFVMRYGSVETAAAALLEKFPNIEGLGDTLHAQQMNMFEAHAIVRKPQLTLGASRFTTSSVDGSTLLQVGQELHLQDSINVKALADPECRDKRNTHDKLSGALLHSQDCISGEPFVKAVVSDRRHPHEKLSDAQAPFRDYVALEGFADAVEETFADTAEMLFADAVFCDKGIPHGGWPDLQGHFRVPMTEELDTEPVICESGHTYERSPIELHFSAGRVTMAETEERLRYLNGIVLTADESCNLDRKFDPTCSISAEPISEIRINNDQRAPSVQSLVKSVQTPIDDGELEDWRKRRKEKTRLAQERRARVVAQSTLQSTQESRQHESKSPSVVSINSNTVLMQSQSFDRAGHFYLGVAVALCPDDWERPAREQVTIPRCSNSCCRTRLETTRQGACARCTLILCSDCLVFHVKEAKPRYSDVLDDDHAICPECVAQILHVLRTRSATESDTGESRLIRRIDEALRQFLASLMDQKAELQHQVLQYRIHQAYATDAKVLSQRIEELLQEKGNARESTQDQANAAKTDRDVSAFETKLPATDTPTEDEVRLQIRISEISAEWDEIDWTTEEGMIRGSLLEHQLNEATADLGVAMSLRLNEANLGEKTAGSEETTEHVKDLECRCAAAMAEHDALVDEGPSDEHDDVFGMKVSELMHRYDQLSMELTQAKEELEQRQQSHALPVPGFSIGTTARATCDDGNDQHGFLGLSFASSLTRMVLMPFTSRKSASNSDHASSSLNDHAGDASSGDVTASSNHSKARIEVEDNTELILPSLNAATVEIAISDLAAIGTIGIDDVIELPLDLRYPSVRIRHQVLVLRNNLELARLESERALDEYYGSLRQQLQSLVDSLEDELVTLHREVANAQAAAAAAEERLRQERIARREAAELQRKRLEEERAAEAERLRQEQERLETARRKEEEATRQSLQGLDIRRCGNPSCGYGPFEKQWYECINMATHNDEYFFIDSNGRRQKGNGTSARNANGRIRIGGRGRHLRPRLD
ncbi:hypothetical protein MHU86_25299 [Fragilaria crotonensis]|nr:hypothetical protein MHU86_25299 [Fragilaria crotonensis]